MTNPSNRKRVVTDDDLQVLDAHIAYAKEQGDRAAGAASDIQQFVGEAQVVLGELADTRTSIEQSAAYANGLAGVLPENILAPGEAKPARADGTHLVQTSSTGLLERFKRVAGAWTLFSQPLMTLLGLQIRQGVNPMDFGAVGDDVHDDTAAFLAAAATGKPIIVTEPPVAWRLSAVVRVNNSVIGVGNRPLIKRYGAIGTQDVDVTFLARGYVGNGMVFRNLTIDAQLAPGDNYPISPAYTGPGGPAEQGFLIAIEASSNVTVEYCTLKNVPGDHVFIGPHNTTAETLTLPRWCTNIIVRHNDMTRPRRCNVAVVSCKGAWITDNYMQKTGNYVAMVDIEPDNNATLRVENVTVARNRADGPDAIFVNLYNPLANPQPMGDIIVDDNEINCYLGIRQTTGRSKTITARRNKYTGVNSSAYFVLLNNACDMLILKDNVDYGGNVSGWSINNQSGFVISGNIWVNATRQGALTLDGCTNGIVSGNFFKIAASTGGVVAINGTTINCRNVQFLNNQIVGANYAVRLQLKPAYDLLFDSNIIDATGRVLMIDSAAAGSTVQVTPSNVITGGAQVVVGTLGLQTTPIQRLSTSLTSYRSASPTTGYYDRNHIIHNDTPTVGAVSRWATITAGWASETVWTASTAIALGGEVYTSSRVYRATVAGTTGATAPVHVTGTAVDGTVTWQYLGVRAAFASGEKLTALIPGATPTLPAVPTITYVSGPTGTLTLIEATATDSDPVRPSYRLIYTWAPTDASVTLVRLRINGPAGYVAVDPLPTAVEADGTPCPWISRAKNTDTNTYIYLTNPAALTTARTITVTAGYKLP